MKRYLFLTLAVLLCTLSASAYDFMVDGIAYEKNNGGKSVYVTTGGDYTGDIVIPENVAYGDRLYSVTSIGERAFYCCKGLSSVTIGNSVTSIGMYAFNHCGGLTSVTIPNSVTLIDSCAFADCTSLASVTIPTSVTKIGGSAFEGCTCLTSVTIPTSVTSIGGSAFKGTPWYNNHPDGIVYIGKVAYKFKGKMPSWTAVAIKEGTVSISDGAFYGCDSLTSVAIPNSVTTIGEYAFYSCDSLTSVTIPDSVTSIGGSAFDCTSWYNNHPDGIVYIGMVAYKFKGKIPSRTAVAIKEGTACISDRAFDGCTGLTSVTIPNSVTLIGRFAFYGCSSLTSVNIPNSVTKIGERVFEGCTGLTSVTIGNSVTSIGERTFMDCTGLTSVAIGNTVSNIGWRAFFGCTSLTSVTFNAENCESPISSDLAWFKDCPLTSLTVGNDVKSIPKYLAYNQTKLKTVTIGNSVTSISDEAFGGCTGLTSVIIPNSVTSIGESAFKGCTGLTSVTIPNSVTTIGEGAFAGCTGLSSVTIPTSVTSIGYYAFSGCTGLTSVTIPNSVTTIGEGAFSGCTGLSSVTIPTSVTSISERTFMGCTGLSSVTIPTSDTSISERTFMGCAGLSSVIIPNSVTSIGRAAFYGCTGLLSVTIPNSVTSIGVGVFEGCTRLTSVTIPNSVTSIGGSAFSCTGLSSVTIPNSVTSIDGAAFKGCTRLTSVTIGNSVTSIGEDTFSECTNLKKVCSLNSVPPVIYESTFSFYDADLFVPHGSLSAYKSAKGWSNFSNIKEFQVTVKAESISLNKQSANLMIGDTLSLTAKVLPENASTKTVVWSSNNPDVASVNDEGLVTALTAGTAIISATTTDGTVLSDSATIVVSTPTSSPSLSVGNYLCVNGDIVTVALSLANKQEIGGFQTDFTVPDGFTVALNSKGKYDITLNADRCVDHVVTTNKLSDGSIRVLAYSPSAEPFIGESGEICYIKLVADEDVKEGDHQLVFREILISESNGKGHRCDDITSVLSTMPVILGDVNNDHKVNVQDVLLTANVSVGKDVDGFVFRAADINKDGIINVSDVLLVANIAVGNSVTVSAAPRFGESHDVLHVSDFMLNSGEERTVDVMFDNTVDFSALQMNLRLPAGVNLKNVALTGRATDGHAVVYNENTPGNINLMAFAASTESFTGNDGAILKLTLQADKSFCGEGAIELTDVKLAESDGYTREADDASARISAVATGVEGVYSVVCAYAEGQNIVIESTDAGKAQIVRPNGVMQEVKVNVGRNTYPMADGGIYFICFAGKTFKVII